MRKVAIVAHNVKRVKFGMVHESSRKAVIRKASKMTGVSVEKMNNGWLFLKWDILPGEHIVTYDDGMVN